MASPPLSELIEPDPPDEVLQFLLTQLASFGFPTTSWQSGGRVYTVLRAVSVVVSDVITTVSEVAKGGLLGLSTQGWLTLLASESYDVVRFSATFAQGLVQMTVASGAGPYTINVGASIIKEALTGLRYTSSNEFSIILPAGPSSTLVPFKADTAGSAYNVPAGSGITFVTPMPGVTAAFIDNGLGTWLTAFGTDEETDDALRIRCRTKWATIGLHRAKDAYIYLAMNVPGVGTKATKVSVDDSNPRGYGTLDIWVAGDAGPLPSADITIVSDYLVNMKSISCDLQVANAAALPITISATVTYQGAYVTAIGDAQSNLQKLIQSTVIGGTLLRAQVIEEIMSVPGVVNVTIPTVLLNGTAGDMVIPTSQVAVFFAFTYVPVIV